MPKVSVCIPTYNRANYLRYSLESVLAQTEADFELIICDDASPDATAETVERYQDSRIRYIRHDKNQGRSRNMRSGFDAAQGKYFIKFDDDDALTPAFLEKTVSVLEQQGEVDFVCTNHWIINANNQRMESATEENSARWGKDKIAEGIIADLLWQTFIYQSLQVGSSLFRRESLAAVDYMRPEADGCEDFDLLVRLALAGYQGYFIPQYLMEYRFHGGQTSLAQSLHFLQAKLFCTKSYRFPDPRLEAKRVVKAAELEQDLGIRLIEKGEGKAGRELLQASIKTLGSSQRAKLGLLLSYLPVNLREAALGLFRRLRPQTYTDKVRLESVD